MCTEGEAKISPTLSSCVYVCVCARVLKREREKERERVCMWWVMWKKMEGLREMCRCMRMYVHVCVCTCQIWVGVCTRVCVCIGAYESVNFALSFLYIWLWQYERTVLSLLHFSRSSELTSSLSLSIYLSIISVCSHRSIYELVYLFLPM